MGLLDDAIREHLDLKRRRGADPGEVERAEREALGPVRRNREPADTAEPEELAAAPGGVAYDHAEDQDWAHDSLHEPADEEFAGEDWEEEGHQAPAASRPPAEEPPSAAPARDWTEAERDDPPAEPFPTAPPSPHRLSDMGGGETVEYKIEDALASEDEGEADDDVLEETPEFLQDTPDHDRLWFEQRPPRDFDFDG